MYDFTYKYSLLYNDNVLYIIFWLNVVIIGTFMSFFLSFSELWK